MAPSFRTLDAHDIPPPRLATESTMDFQTDHPSSDSFSHRLVPVSHEAQLRDHRLLLHRLYVTEKKTMKAVMDYMETHFQLRVG